MANANVNRLGQINQAGDERALFLKIFAGEVLTAFEKHNLMMPLHKVRTITNGKSASFPVTGRISAEYHVPGTEISGLNVNHAERILEIDALLISHAFVADIDEAMNHYDVRSIYSTEMGRKLANQADANIIKEFIKAARSAAVIADAGYPGGSQIKNDKFRVGGVGSAADVQEQAREIAAGLFAATQKLDENDVPDENRYFVTRPDIYYAMAQNTDLINKDWGGAGAYADGKILRVAGVQILKSNNVPKVDSTATDTYHGVDASKTVGVVFTTEAVGTVKLMDLSMQSEWDIRRQGTLMVARYAMGHGVLRPECTIELALDTLTR